MPTFEGNLPLVDRDSTQIPTPRLLVVDDDETLLFTLKLVLERSGFEVRTANNVKDALHLIASLTFDVLLSDLHMPQPGDGLTVVSAMRHSNPKAVTLIFSAFPEMKLATAAILQQADEILIKPMGVDLLVQTIRARITTGTRPPPAAIEDVASILEHESQQTIDAWLQLVQFSPHTVYVQLGDKARCAYLPQLLRDLVFRLRYPLPLGSHTLVSAAAAQHGLLRRQQGYTAAMMVEESRMLQVSIFQTLQNNLTKIDFSTLLVGVMSIADEVDSQLAQQMAAYISESKTDDLPVTA